MKMLVMYDEDKRHELIRDMVRARKLLKEDDSFKKRLIEALSKLDENEWELLEKIAKKLAKKD